MVVRYSPSALRNADVQREIRQLDLTQVGFCEVEW